MGSLGESKSRRMWRLCTRKRQPPHNNHTLPCHRKSSPTIPTMVLDAFSAVSLAATIVQFVDFSSKIVSKGYHLYRSADGILPENARLGYVIADLKDLNARLQVCENVDCLTKDEQSLADLSSQCSEVATELMRRLEKLSVEQHAKNRRWRSFRQALKSVWSKEALDEMAKTLSRYRSQLQLHILLSLRYVENASLLSYLSS